MKNLLYIFGLLIVIFACKGEDSEKEGEHDSVDTEIGDIVHVETLFDEKKFPDASHFELLKELDICDTLPANVVGCASCTPEFFKIHAFKETGDIKDAFMVQIKALTVLKGQSIPLPVRHLMVFERENGSLVKINGFRGNLIATRANDSGYKDLVIRFYIPEDDAFINCLFVWKDKKYSFKSAEAIEGGGGHGAIKAEFKDSISGIVYQSLMSNGMLF